MSDGVSVALALHVMAVPEKAGTRDIARSHHQVSRHDASINFAKMSWSLAAPKTPHREPQTYQLSQDNTAYIVPDDHGALRIVHELNPDKHIELGRIGKLTTST